jgi:hypothetical protein
MILQSRQISSLAPSEIWSGTWISASKIGLIELVARSMGVRRETGKE